jgi:uncharacterized protein YceH (UPF0502 family)
MEVQLNAVEVRVLGSMMEKEATTPEYYPLSLNALCAACNQKSNRDPVMSLDEDTVLAAIEHLKAKGMALDISGGEHRVHKYSHRLGEVFNFDRREQMVMCVLMLRGPQTVGELRGRMARVYAFDGLAEVESIIGRLAERTPPLAQKLDRQPGEKEPRFAHLLSGEVERAALQPPAAPPARTSPFEERLARVETELAELKRQFDVLRKYFE